MEVFRIENATSPKKQKSILEQRSKVLIDRPREANKISSNYLKHILYGISMLKASFACVGCVNRIKKKINVEWRGKNSLCSHRTNKMTSDVSTSFKYEWPRIGWWVLFDLPPQDTWRACIVALHLNGIYWPKLLVSDVKLVYNVGWWRHAHCASPCNVPIKLSDWVSRLHAVIALSLVFTSRHRHRHSVIP